MADSPPSFALQKEFTLLRFFFLLLFFGWLLRVGVRILRLVRGPRPSRRPQSGPGQDQGSSGEPAPPGWEEEGIEEADYEELP